MVSQWEAKFILPRFQKWFLYLQNLEHVQDCSECLDEEVLDEIFNGLPDKRWRDAMRAVFLDVRLLENSKSLSFLKEIQ